MLHVSINIFSLSVIPMLKMDIDTHTHTHPRILIHLGKLDKDVQIGSIILLLSYS